MIEYSFRFGIFHFKIHGDSDKDAVNKARRAIEESMAKEVFGERLDIGLTGGAFDGCICVIPEEITISNICKRIPVNEVEGNLSF